MKIYLFNNSKSGTNWNVCYAITEEGEVLASHVCSHIAFMRGDLYYNRPERIAEWATRFGEVEIIEVPQDQCPPDEVFEKNKLRNKPDEGDTAKAEIEFSAP